MIIKKVIMKKTKKIFNQQKRFIFGFFNDNAGSIIIPFAIMLPTIALCFAFSINTSKTLRDKIAVSEATNEASLAVLALNNKNEGLKANLENKAIAQSYINYYLKNEINANSYDTDSMLDVIYDKEKKEYYISYNRKVDALIKSDSLGKLGSSIDVNNDQKGYGNTRRQEINLNKYDIAFIADFSGSSTCLESDGNCNKYSEIMEGTSSIKPKIRINAAMSAIKKIVDVYSQPEEYSYALIPYDIGVPIANNGKNILGGQSYSCSVPYKLKNPFDTIDFEFWANKNIFFREWKKLKDAGKITNYLNYTYFGVQMGTGFFGIDHSSFIFYYLDYYNYKYYSKIVGPAKNYFNDYQLQTAGYCKKNYQTPGSTAFAKYRYSCGIDQKDYPLSDSNRRKVEKQYAYMVQLYDYMYSDDSGYNNHLSLANNNTIDFDGTINNLFAHNYKPITFTRPIVPATSDFTPFQAMCSSPLYNNGVMFAGQSKLHESELFDSTYWKVPLFKNGPYLVDLTSASEISDILGKASWKPGGGTDTMSGFLTSIPILYKGKGDNKIFIVLSDGKDDSGAEKLTETFLNKKDLCLTTRRVFLNNQVKSTSFHYIKLSPIYAGKSIDSLSEDEAKQEFGPWVNCVKSSYKTSNSGLVTTASGGDDYKKYLHFASDELEVFEITREIIEAETGNFILRK